jgi:integrase
MPKLGAGISAAKVRSAKPGRYTDRDGLILFVRNAEARFWLLRYSFQGARREMGLGRAGEGPGSVTLAEARERVAELRRGIKAGIDPLAARDAEAVAQKAAAQQAAAHAVTFRAVAELYMGAHETAWRNAKHRDQWRSTLATYAFPFFGELPVGDVLTAHVMSALAPVWNEKPETASRVRGRIESVLDYATARGWRTGENPARWRGHLANLLPARGKVARVEHHAALPWRDVGAFMVALGEREAGSVAALALRFVVLTAARSGEVLGARWAEIDMAEAVWTVPGDRMKAGREHRVPLTAAALDVLRQAAALRTSKAADAHVFPGMKPGKGLSIMALAMLLRRMERGDLTVHGFRSTFRDWCSEQTTFDRDTAEAALAHTVRDKVEAAYRRGDLFDKRRRLMEAWADFCARPAAEAGDVVTPIRRKAAR